LVIDVGTGDGRAVLARAAAEPSALVVGLDANAAAMAEGSRRAADRRTGLRNALFVVGAAERPPAELRGRADLVTVTFPWGSLLRGMVGQDDAVLAGVASLLAGGGMLDVVMSAEARDAAVRDPFDDRARTHLAAAWTSAGLTVDEVTGLAPDLIAAIPSSWARRLRADPTRHVWRITATRDGR
jgi:16S rRNA (adenine(1408)-N(1))-methyltransferase